MLNPKLKGTRWTKELEKPIYESWKKNKIYKFNKASKKLVYSIDTPPPYSNTPVHIGQATTYVMMDMFARFKRMTGYELLFPLGLDKNGLPIEIETENRYKIKLTETTREKFIKLCKKILEEAGSATIDSFLRLGISFNSFDIGTKIGDVYETDSEIYRKLTQDTFIELFNKGLIYEGTYLTNYCPGCRTTLADAEVIRETKETNLNFVKFRLEDSKEHIIIATTRPELLCTAALVIFNPNDNRYKHLEGKMAVIPVFNRMVSILSHNFADPEFGTGLVYMSASAGDQDAVRFLREMNIQPISCISIDGKMNEKAGILKGLKTKDAREKIISLLKQEGILVKQEKLIHNIPVCERSKDEIEFISLPELYLKQAEFKKELLQLQGKINFYDETSRHILVDWINSISIDWPISRSRYYGTEIPLWYCKRCNKEIIPKKGKYYIPWKYKCPISKCKCGSKEFVGETRVFDTWFDSSSSVLYILGYDKDKGFFSRNFPCSLRPQGKEIIRNWLYYTLLKSYLLTKKPAFKEVWINHHIIDEKGHKMSKSLGNVIDPSEVLDKFGAEPFRLWSAIEGNLEKADFRCSFKRIEGASKTITKLWNIARFISMFPDAKKPKKLEYLDSWIINELNNIIKFARERYSNYDFHNPAIRLKNFIWETFASHYLELVKPRAYNKDNKFTKQQQSSALFTLHYCLGIILKLLSPVNPFITYKIYKHIKNKDIHFEKFPKSDRVVKLDFTTNELIELNSNIWKSKKGKNLSLKDKIGKLVIPEKFNKISKDLLEAHNVKELKFGSFKIEV